MRPIISPWWCLSACRSNSRVRHMILDAWDGFFQGRCRNPRLCPRPWELRAGMYRERSVTVGIIVWTAGRHCDLHVRPGILGRSSRQRACSCSCVCACVFIYLLACVQVGLSIVFVCMINGGFWATHVFVSPHCDLGVCLCLSARMIICVWGRRTRMIFEANSK